MNWFILSYLVQKHLFFPHEIKKLKTCSFPHHEKYHCCDPIDHKLTFIDDPKKWEKSTLNLHRWPEKMRKEHSRCLIKVYLSETDGQLGASNDVFPTCGLNFRLFLNSLQPSKILYPQNCLSITSTRDGGASSDQGV